MKGSPQKDHDLVIAPPFDMSYTLSYDTPLSSPCHPCHTHLDIYEFAAQLFGRQRHAWRQSYAFFRLRRLGRPHTVRLASLMGWLDRHRAYCARNLSRNRATYDGARTVRISPRRSRQFTWRHCRHFHFSSLSAAQFHLKRSFPCVS